MKDAMVEYAEKASKEQNWWSIAEIEKFNKEHKTKYINNNIYFIPKDAKTSLKTIENDLGYTLPVDILDYINLFGIHV